MKDCDKVIINEEQIIMEGITIRVFVIMEVFIMDE